MNGLNWIRTTQRLPTIPLSIYLNKMIKDYINVIYKNFLDSKSGYLLLEWCVVFVTS